MKFMEREDWRTKVKVSAGHTKMDVECGSHMKGQNKGRLCSRWKETEETPCPNASASIGVQRRVAERERPIKGILKQLRKCKYRLDIRW